MAIVPIMFVVRVVGMILGLDKWFVRLAHGKWLDLVLYCDTDCRRNSWSGGWRVAPTILRTPPMLLRPQSPLRGTPPGVVPAAVTQ